MLLMVPMMFAWTASGGAQATESGWGQQEAVQYSAALAGLRPNGKAEPFLDCAVLGWTDKPVQVLVAKQLEPRRYLLETLSATGKASHAEIVTFAEGEEVPEFSAKALRKWPVAAALLKQMGMKNGRSKKLEERARAVLSQDYSRKEVTFKVITPSGSHDLLSVDRRAKRMLFPYFAPGGRLCLLAGWIENPGDNVARTGVLVVLPLGKSKGFSDLNLAGVWLEEARNRMVHEYYAEAEELLLQASGRHESPAVWYELARAKAYQQDWEAAAQLLDRLSQYQDPHAEDYRQAVEHQPLLREARLHQVDINGDKEYWFKASKGYEGTSVWVKIKNSEGRSVAIFKPTNGNTYHRGEIFTYQVAKLLGLEVLYPVTYLHTLDKTGCDKFIAALDKVKFKSMKETNRKKLIKQCRRKGKLEGAVKEWVQDFQFFQAIGKVEKVKKHKVFYYLSKRHSQPPVGKSIKAKTITRLYKPDHCKKATYRGTLELAQFAQDLSDLMVVDVLNANEDRFPGANVDFKSLGKSKETSTCDFQFGPSRLFSLDNGATFKGTYSNAYVDFTKRLKPSRFSKRTYVRLKAIQNFIAGKRSAPRFLRNWGLDSVSKLSVFLTLDKGDSHKRRKQPFKLFEANLRNVLKRLNQFKDDKHAWFVLPE